MNAGRCEQPQYQRWSVLGLMLSVPFACWAVKGYWTLMRCALAPWLGPCPDQKGAGWLTFFLGLPWSAAATSGGLSEVVYLAAPALNAVLLYNLGRLVQYAWPAIGDTRHWRR